MKFITLMEPWATLMMLGYKRVETRSWGTDYRGDVAIHAGKNPECVKDVSYVMGLFERAGIPMLEGFPMRASEYPLGRIIAVGRLVDVKRMDRKLIAAQTKMERAFGDWRPKRSAFFFEEVRRTTYQIEWKGALGLRDLPWDIAEKVVA